MKNTACCLVFVLMILSCQTKTDTRKNTKGIAVIAYYSGNASLIDSFEIEKLTHIIFSFCHLKNNRLSVDNANDTATIQKLVSLKKRNAGLKVLLSLGGWGGCEFCSQVFSTDEGRKQFAGSAKELNIFFQTDGIDLDWEYPGIEGHPGHQWLPSDKQNFTLLIRSLRDSLGGNSFISFAAGGFKKFFDESVEWEKVMPLLDMVNIMSYDLVHGYSTVTGHHTPLYSSTQQVESADRAVRYLDSLGVGRNKMVIGSAFYGRVWENVDSINNGLYRPGKFKSFTPFRSFSSEISTKNGFSFFTDTITQSSYAYNGSRKLFATFDDESSISRKTAYAVKEGLGGIMFWELSLDKLKGGLLHVIDSTKASLR